MITCEQIIDKKCSCDNCNRITKLSLKYKFIDVRKKGREDVFVTLVLCEDCANAVANLFYAVMEESKKHKYIKDEIHDMEGNLNGKQRTQIIKYISEITEK